MAARDPLTLAEVAELNSAWRFGFGPSTSSLDKLLLAERYGVDVRTVQRWTTQGAEQRNAIPESAAGRELDDLPEELAQRVEDTRLLAEGYYNPDADNGGRVETAVERFSTVVDALDEVALWGETGDTFHDLMIFSATFRETEGGRVVDIVYTREYDRRRA